MRQTFLAAVSALALSVAPALSESVKIGVIAPLSGAGAAWGVALTEAVRFAIEDANAAGGLSVKGKKEKVELIAYDDQYKASEAVSAYNRMVKQDGIKHMFILGSAATMALKPAIQDDDVLVLTGAYASKAIEADSRNLIRLLSTPKEYIPPLIGWIKANIPGRRVAIINPNDEAGWDILKFSSEAYDKEGYQILAKELTERTQKDFQSLLTRIVALKPDIIDLGGLSPTTLGLAVRQARELGYTKQFVAMGGPGPRDVVAAAGAQAAEGMISILYADPANKEYQAIVERFRKKIGQMPNEYIVPPFDAARVLLKAMELSGDPNDTKKVQAAFTKALPMNSLQGQALTFGGKEAMGIDAQIMTVNIIGKLRDGEPVAVGLAK